jgi:hypothetical protein
MTKQFRKKRNKLAKIKKFQIGMMKRSEQFIEAVSFS